MALWIVVSVTPFPSVAPTTRSQVAAQTLFWQVLLPVQATQAEPPLPQAVLASPVWHAPFRQQPFGQVEGLQAGGGGGVDEQTPLEQVRFPVQEAQAPPFAPQAFCAAPTRQVVPSQHPEQLVLLHFALLDFTQRPPLQIIPVQQLKSSRQRDPLGWHPASHRPLMHVPEQQ
jgi:hypothetical protein